MRELKECTAEVFRRSEQRIKERRRKRNRVLAVCIPVGLIAALSSAVIFPPMMSKMESDSFTGEAAGSAPESAACPYTAAEIQAGTPPEHCGEVTDQLAVAELFGAVNSLFADAGDDRNNLPASEAESAESFPAENPPSDAADENQAQAETAGKWKGCTITFTAGDGSQVVFRLRGNTLVNVSTNETVFLSDAQAAGLLAVLGISE